MSILVKPSSPWTTAVLDRTAATITSTTSDLSGPSTSGDARGPNWVPLARFPAAYSLGLGVPAGGMRNRLGLDVDGDSYVENALAVDSDSKMANREMLLDDHGVGYEYPSVSP